MRQGRCTLPADEAGRVLDRLTGLEKIIPSDVVLQALEATGRINQRACRLTYEVTLWVVLAMGIFTDVSIRQVFKLCRRLHRHEETPTRSALCIARQRLGIEPLQALCGRVIRPLANPQTPGAFYKGMRLMGIDGTLLNVPDTASNADAFGRPSSGDRGEGAFPQVRKLSLVELGTHAEIAIAIGSYHCGEQSLVSDLIDALPPDSLLLEDRGFFSYDAWKTLDSRGIKLLVRAKSNFVLKPIQRLSDGSYLAKIYPNDYARKKDRHGIVVRVIRYTLNEPARVGHGEEHILLTNLLDEEFAPALELIALYHERWEEELVFDEQKTHQDPRRATKPANLRSETPQGVKQEVYALSLAHFVIRALMFEAAEQAGLDSDRLSFTGCYQILKCRLPECDSRTAATFSDWFQALLEELQRERTEPRRNRVNPRVIKQKMSKWPKKRPEHRGIPPPTKTFIDSVVLTI
jgi:hypothetical protein